MDAFVVVFYSGAAIVRFVGDRVLLELDSQDTVFVFVSSWSPRPVDGLDTRMCGVENLNSEQGEQLYRVVCIWSATHEPIV